MNKIYKMIGCAFMLSTAMTISAQQLPNYGFESWKSACGSTEAFGTGTLASPKKGEMRQRPGVEPAEWNGSSINQKVMLTKTQELVFDETSDKVGGSHAVKMQNIYIGVGSVGSVAPGFITLGTPWVYASSTLSDCDGGTYGGVSFTSKPDAIVGSYKRTDSNDEESHIIVYLWNGTFKSNVGKKSSPDQSRENVERAILGTATATQSGTLVGKCDYAFKSTTNAGWEEIIVPIEYVSTEAPTMMNVVISGGDYWSRSAMKENTTLYADNIKFLYYSRLNDLQVAGVSVDGFSSDVYSYTMAGTELPSESDITVSHMGVGASHSVSIDAINATVTVTVENAGNDVDDLASHSYVLQYEKAPAGETKEYEGYLNVTSEMLGGVLVENQANKITIIESADGATCTFILPDFRLAPDADSMGDIVVENVTITYADGKTNYNGSVKDMVLAGDIYADVVMSGSITDAGVVDMIINVNWTNSGMVDEVPIVCTFTSTKSGIDSILAPELNENAPVEYYNLQGVKVANPENGVYIRVQGSKATKVYVK